MHSKFTKKKRVEESPYMETVCGHFKQITNLGHEVPHLESKFINIRHL